MPTETSEATVADPEAPAVTPTPPTRPVDDRVTVIRPPSRFPRLDVAELWAYRELFGILVWRDLKVRYKQTAIGAIWAVFQPVLIAAVYTVVFGRFANFLRDGLLPGLRLRRAASDAVLQRRDLVGGDVAGRERQPRHEGLLPAGPAPCLGRGGAGGRPGPRLRRARRPDGDLGPVPGLARPAAPAFLGLAVLTAVGVVLLLSAINVRYRDVPHAIPVFLQVLPLLSGVPFAIDQAPEKWQWILSLNPLTAVVSGWRWCILGSAEPVWGQVLLGVGVAVLLALVGLVYFRRSEPRFADMI